MIFPVFAIPDPSKCDQTISMLSSKKTLCYVNQRLPRSQALKVCDDFGMEMFDAKSSKSVSYRASKLAKELLHGKKKDFIQVRGRVKGPTKCNVINGAGVAMNLWCHLPYPFLCEYKGEYTISLIN
jgi:hypothetical protein